MNILFAASGLEAMLIMLVFVGISAVSSWLKKKQQAAEDAKSEALPEDQPAAPPPRFRPGAGAPASPAAAPSRRGLNWEDELRRLLEGDTSESAPPPVIVPPKSRPATPAPLVAAPPPIPSRPPVMAQARPVVRRQKVVVRPVVRPPPVRPVAEIPEGGGHDVEAYFQRLESLRAAKAAATPIQPHSPGSVQVRAWLRDPQALRSAVLASVILGRPKAWSG